MRSTGTVACELGTSWGFDEKSIWVRDGCSAEFSLGTKPSVGQGFGRYVPGRGFKVADTSKGELNIDLYAVVRYLNQRALDDTYTDSFGNTRSVKQRQDIQVNKAIVFFQGWLMSPQFVYSAYVWTTNTSQGLPAQVVLAGFFVYTFNPRVALGVGISGLPGVRSTEGQWPNWLGTDQRLIADEFFRPSYTTGLFARGEVAKGLRYSVMWGNNLSQLGVDAGQLGNNMSAVSGSLVWMPTTGEFGATNGFGDFEGHDTVATRLGIHYTRSDEDRQEQPGTEAPDNVQIRLSDGNVVFTPGLFGPGISVTDVVYQMESLDAGVKNRGFALEGEYDWRRLSNFRGPDTNTLPFDHLTDTGFQLQASAMVVPKTAQIYLSGSKIFGNYGNPSDVRVGVNVFPWKNQVVRWNTELLYLNRSPVGYLSVPFTVGGNGPVFHSNLEVNF